MSITPLGASIPLLTVAYLTLVQRRTPQRLGRARRLLAAGELARPGVEVGP